MNEKKSTLILEKKIGQTPLQVLEEFKKNNPEYQGIKMAYAGRLDPMAEGQLLVLVGDTCKERDKYLGLNKEYEFEILLGFKTDSQDVLGLAKYGKPRNFFKTIFFRRDKQRTPIKNILKKLHSFIGKHNWEYPIFSSKTVQGKPLFLWALEKRISEIEIPHKEIEIYELEFLSEKFLKTEKVKEKIFQKINSIPEVQEKSKELGADFRRAEIRQKWNNIFNKIPNEKEFQIIKIRCKCSSGTYMRVLAQQIAQKLGQYGTAFSIKRTQYF